MTFSFKFEVRQNKLPTAIGAVPAARRRRFSFLR